MFHLIDFILIFIPLPLFVVTVSWSYNCFYILLRLLLIILAFFHFFLITIVLQMPRYYVRVLMLLDCKYDFMWCFYILPTTWSKGWFRRQAVAHRRRPEEIKACSLTERRNVKNCFIVDDKRNVNNIFIM